MRTPGWIRIGGVGPRAAAAVLASAALFASSARAGASETSLEEILRRYPPRETNAAALDAERLAAPLGIVLVPQAKTRIQPAPTPTRAAFEKIESPLYAWMSGELQRTSGDTLPPPEAVEAFLSLHEPHLAALRRGLLRGEPPVWEERADPTGPLPNLLGLIKLQKLLIADALDARRKGQTEVAHEDLEASWHLNASLSESPILITRLIGQAATRLQVGALRRVDPVPPVWRSRLRAQAPLASMIEVARLDASLWPLHADEAITDGSLVALRRALLGGITRMCLRDAARVTLARLDRIDPEEGFCDQEFFSARDLWEEASWWNPLGNGFSGGDDYLRRASRLALEIEMTLKILDLRAAHAENAGHWPSAPREIERSRICPKDHWIYEAGPDGRMRLALSRQPDWGQPFGTVLPIVFEQAPTTPHPAGKPRSSR